MIKIKDIGSFNEVPQIVEDIIAGNIDALAAYFTPQDINRKIKISQYTERTPLDLALIMEQFLSVQWLTEQGAELNAKDNASFVTAVRYGDEKTIRYLVSQGAKVDGTGPLGKDAYVEALYGKQRQHLPLIQELGHRVDKHGGRAFRQAVSNRDYDALDFFLSHGVDINYNGADQVYPFKPTSLCVAVRYVDLQMVKYLVNYGADVTMAEKDGMRPYSIALEAGNLEMAEYLKSLEPPEFHSLQNKLDELRSYKLSKDLLGFLQQGDLRLDLPDSGFEYLEFFSLMDTVPMTVGRKKLLRISKSTGDYDHIVFLWSPKAKKLAYYDVEHQELGEMCKFEEFLQAPAVHLQKVIDGEYGESYIAKRSHD